MNWDNEIKGLLKTELSAVETYEQAVGERAWKLLRGVHAHHLIHILVDHLEAASQLQTEIQQTTGTPVRLVDGSDRGDSWFTLHTAAAKLFRDAKLFSEEATVRALKEGEGSRLKASLSRHPPRSRHTDSHKDPGRSPGDEAASAHTRLRPLGSETLVTRSGSFAARSSGLIATGLEAVASFPSILRGHPSPAS